MQECKKLISLVTRNTKCYFKDKLTFFMSLLSPLILFVLFITFLKNVYVSSFKSIADAFGVTIEQRVLNGATGGWLMSSILSVSSVTVAFCSNIIMVDDKINSVINDFKVAPVKKITVQISYFISNFFVTLLVLMSVMLVGHIYLACVGWYMSVSDVFLIIVDCICGILFGTLLAGIVESFISTQGGISAVSTLVSSMYGFICGAYMPLSQFSSGLRNILCMLPGIYGVGALRNHYMGGSVEAMVEGVADSAAADEMRKALLDGFDANLYFFNNKVSLGAMYIILLTACAVLFGIYVVIIYLKSKKKK